MNWSEALTVILSVVSVIITMLYIHRENQKETKEFHGRMCTLEERYYQLMQRYFEKKEKK